ncbi:hypothetical protein G4G28_02040 [Massilia sp. Dwa41.01b]|uniref:hypothetical protein n=1 Tax=unclassified Massilia TaxID=2609279 RepID=UPI001603ABFB|nr:MULTISPECIES: hypothetical protein [unclassified Massilia]QNA87547.1 hypothetical protein G4G28_02040 [Massilia sp. Dwa41.01b]QNA98457.1 hypothetical protein G4G31_05795 [Massilia sp. Se16.2.3]
MKKTDASMIVPSETRQYINHLGGTFSGPRETLVAILNPHVANWLKAKTARTKQRLAALNLLKCYNPDCDIPDEQITSFDTAHPVGRSRPQIIREAIDALNPVEAGDKDMGLKDCDIAAVLRKARELHLEMLITFLCNACNRNHHNLSIDKIPSKILSEWISESSKTPGR